MDEEVVAVGDGASNIIGQAAIGVGDIFAFFEQNDFSEFVGSAGGGMVKVTVSGAKEVLAVSINPQAIDPDDIEMLEDLVTAAVNDALNKAAEKERELMPMAGNLGL